MIKRMRKFDKEDWKTIRGFIKCIFKGLWFNWNDTVTSWRWLKFFLKCDYEGIGERKEHNDGAS